MKHDKHEEREMDSNHDHASGNGTASMDVKSTKGGQYDKVPAGYSGTIYICPMHPEVRDVEDSRCPICNMFLKPADSVIEDNVAEMAEMKDKHANCHGAANTEVKSVKGGKYDKVPAGYSGMVYICPMHPEVRDVENSGCPICGMGA